MCNQFCSIRLLLGMPALQGVCAARRHGLRRAERRPLDEQHARLDRRQARSAVLSQTQDALLASPHASATCCAGTLTCPTAAGGAGDLACYKEWRHRMMFDDD
jgi:hypothetical protein